MCGSEAKGTSEQQLHGGGIRLPCGASRATEGRALTTRKAPVHVVLLYSGNVPEDVP